MDEFVIHCFGLGTKKAPKPTTLENALQTLIMSDGTIILIVDRPTGELRIRKKRCTVSSGGISSSFGPFDTVFLHPGIQVTVQYDTGQKVLLGRLSIDPPQ